MNIVMQLRKVCNHPDLFQRRSTHVPFLFEGPRWSPPNRVVAAAAEAAAEAAAAAAAAGEGDLGEGRPSAPSEPPVRHALPSSSLCPCIHVTTRLRFSFSSFCLFGLAFLVPPLSLSLFLIWRDKVVNYNLETTCYFMFVSRTPR